MFKDTLREIKKSLGRFISLFAICFIGVAFFAGLTASSGDMKNSSDLYYDDYNLCDIEVMSSKAEFSSLFLSFVGTISKSSSLTSSNNT